MLIETFICFVSAQEHESHDRSAGEAKRFERLTNSGYPSFSCLYGGFSTEPLFIWLPSALALVRRSQQYLR